jgi:hypothetical protein
MTVTEALFVSQPNTIYDASFCMRTHPRVTGNSKLQIVVATGQPVDHAHAAHESLSDAVCDRLAFAASRRPQRAEAADSQRHCCVAAQIRPFVDAALLGSAAPLRQPVALSGRTRGG